MDADDASLWQRRQDLIVSAIVVVVAIGFAAYLWGPTLWRHIRPKSGAHTVSVLLVATYPELENDCQIAAAINVIGLQQGGPVTVTDGAGKVIGVGSIGVGTPDPDRSGACVFPSHVDHVPRVPIYGFVFPAFNTFYVNRADLASRKFTEVLNFAARSTP